MTQRGKRVEGCWVFGGVERLPKYNKNGQKCGYKAGKVFAYVVPRRDAHTLLPLVKRFILPGSHIISDSWSAYKNIKSAMKEQGYSHDMVNHSKNYKDPETGAHTNTIEGAWRVNYKSQIHGRSYSQTLLPRQLYHKMWTRKYQHNSWNAFWRALSKLQSKKEVTGPAPPSLSF